MRTLTSILYGLILCALFILAVKLNAPNVPDDMALIPAGDGVDAFYMDMYEVTNAQYRKFIDANPQWQKGKALTSIVSDGYLSGWKGNMYPKGKANHPVVNISWFAAKAYAEWAGKELPTEAQWEKAARGSLEGKKYPWGNAKPRKRANYNRYTPRTSFKNPPTKAVGSYAPNEYGLYDMAGNVEEWCLERLDVDDIHGRYHRMRGGSWFSGATAIQIAERSQHPVNDSMGTLGFRCVLPKTETMTTEVAIDVAAWLSDEMCGQFDRAFYSVSKGYTALANLDAKLADIVMYNTGYPRTFEKELIRVLREVGPEGIEDMPYGEPTIYHDLILRLWRLYLEVHFKHSNENIFQKLRYFKARVTENIDDVILSDGC
ncbi:hypothetical protein C6503_20700 [Candidatus Poribacteria bacterium]|nr:MAG: hypothetical protein C6503_20700 [Candidatus Poribacteria bacterium]